MTARDLVRTEGTIDRGPYLAIGIVGFAFKHNLDRILATAFFGRRWSVFNYLFPAEGKGLRPDDAAFFAALVLTALPFMWIGVALTLRRLRAVGLPLPLAALFFAPFVNLVFFGVLAAIPTRPAGHAPAGRRALDRWIPDHPLGSAMVALALTVPVGVLGVVLGSAFFQRYGGGLFVGLPFCIGLASVLVDGYHRPRRLLRCLGVSALSATFLGVALVALAVEGFVCVVMGAPIVLALSMLGGAIGFTLQRRPDASADAATLLPLVLALGPLLIASEAANPPEPPLLEVVTLVDVQAPPEVVWRRVVAFAEITEPREWLFRIGIAYPRRAELVGSGVGAVRHCVFSTGGFVEPIEAWDEPYRLAFGVTAQPAPLQEWTPWEGILPPHLGYLRSERGQFRLTPLPGGGTRLEGTTWYRHRIWPTAYWRFWSDFIIHRIHARVLDHIRREAEVRG